MTAWVAALIVPIALVMGLGLGLAQLVVAQQQGQSIADLAALAGAASDRGCSAAELVVDGNAQAAHMNGVRLSRCDVGEGDVRVEVTIPMPELFARMLSWLRVGDSRIRSEARAGLMSLG